MSEAVVAALVSAVVALITSLITARTEGRRLATEFRTEFMAEQAVKHLLEDPRWQQRSFEKISNRIGGFDSDELRRLLVRAGAVRFSGKNGEELWGLRERNREDLG